LSNIGLISYKTKNFKVRYTETDQMGFAHHSNYLNYFEMARIEWLNAMGFSYAELERSGVVMPVVDAQINYKSPAYFDDCLYIVLYVDQMPTAKIQFRYSVYNPADKEIASGSTTLAFLDVSTKRPIRCPKVLIELIQSL
jgi:acyl-CoA thioester hydrolase